MERNDKLNKGGLAFTKRARLYWTLEVGRYVQHHALNTWPTVKPVEELRLIGNHSSL